MYFFITTNKNAMTPTLTILGCGYLGTALAKKAVTRKWEVSALTRNPETANNLRAIGVSLVVKEKIESDAWHSQLNPKQDYVVNCVGAASPNLEGYRKSYLDGQHSISGWLQNGGAKKFIFTSSSSVYPQVDGELIDEESSNCGVSERGELLLAAEKVCLALNTTERISLVLRLAGLYGPGRHLLIDKVRRGERMSGNSSRFLNLIHQSDAVGAIMAVLGSATQSVSRIYNVSDGEHATRGEIVDWLSKKLNLPNPGFEENDGPHSPNRKISNALIQSAFRWTPYYLSFRNAYEEMLAT